MSVLKCEWRRWLWQAGLLKMRTMRLWKFLRWSFFGNQQFVCLEAIVLCLATATPLPAHKANNYVSECTNMERSKHFGELMQPALRQLITQKICKPSGVFFCALAHFEWTLNTPFMSTAWLIAVTRPRPLKHCSLATHFYREIDTFCVCVCREQCGYPKCRRTRFSFVHIVCFLFSPSPLPPFALSQSLPVTLSVTLSPSRFLSSSFVCFSSNHSLLWHTDKAPFRPVHECFGTVSIKLIFSTSVIPFIKHFNYTLNANNTRDFHIEVFTFQKRISISLMPFIAVSSW